MAIQASELILNPDGSVYHLNLLPQDIASDIIFVGDQDRVTKITKYFDSIEVTKQKENLRHRPVLTKENVFQLCQLELVLIILTLL